VIVVGYAPEVDTKSIVFVVVVARKFRILHPINEDAASRQIKHFATMPGAKHFNINYSVGCSGTPYCHIHSQAVL
jgi:hypothetical protein